MSRLPRSREELAWRARVAAAALPAGGELWVAGHHREGIRGAVRQLEEGFGPVVVARSKRRCRVLVATLGEQASRAPADLAHVARTFSAAISDEVSIQCTTLPGVFSHGRLDRGTARLLPWLLTQPPAASVLDLGAGCGVIGAALIASSQTTRVTLVDTSVAACEAARRTVAALPDDQAARATVALADAGDAPAGPYDLVVTNPPFHDGRAQERHHLAAFARAAARRLTPGGRLVVVANRHLGYRDDLLACFGEVEVAWEDTAFRVWSCRGPRGD